MNENPMDRAFQRVILLHLRAHYPDMVSTSEIPNPSAANVYFNVSYLADHQCIRLPGSFKIRDLKTHGDIPVTITANGIDVLEGDGGLSAILNTVTVRLHEDTLRELLKASIERSNIPPEKKQTILDHIKTLPAKVLEKGIDRLLEAGIDQIPDIGLLLQTS